MTVAGKFRFSFNKHGDAPRVWSIMWDNAKMEINVANVRFDGASVITVYKPKETPDDEDGQPSAWLEVYGELTITRDGNAVFKQMPVVVGGVSAQSTGGLNY